MDISFDKLKSKVKQVISERLRAGWTMESAPWYSWDRVYEVMPEVISRALEDAGLLPEGRYRAIEDREFLPEQKFRSVDACKVILSEIEDGAYKIVDQWDIRNAGKLIELFPEALPNKYQKAKFDVDMDEDGEWKIYFKDAPKMGM